MRSLASAYATPFTLPLFLLTILLLLSPFAHSATTTLLDPLGECYLNPNCLQDPKYPPLTVDTPIERGMPVKFENVSYCNSIINTLGTPFRVCTKIDATGGCIHCRWAQPHVCKGVTNVNHKYRCMLMPGVRSPDDDKPRGGHHAWLIDGEEEEEGWLDDEKEA